MLHSMPLMAFLSWNVYSSIKMVAPVFEIPSWLELTILVTVCSALKQYPVG